MTVKSLAMALSLGEPGIPIPGILSGQVLASGYYTDPATGYRYYYNSYRDQWYVVVAGYLYPLSNPWAPSPSSKIEINYGEKLRFKLQFTYIGPAATKVFYATIGDNKTSGSFGQWSQFNVTKNIDLPKCDTATTITDEYIDLELPLNPLFRHDDYDFAAYAKMMDQGIEYLTPYYYNVGHLIAMAGEFSDFSITKFEKAS